MGVMTFFLVEAPVLDLVFLFDLTENCLEPLLKGAFKEATLQVTFATCLYQ